MHGRRREVLHRIHTRRICKVSASEAEAVEKKIAALINKAFKGNKSIKIVTQVSKFSELDLALSLYQNAAESEYEN